MSAPVCDCRECFVFWRVTGRRLTPRTSEKSIALANACLREQADYIRVNPHKEAA